MYDIFESSNNIKKRELINILYSNLTLDGEKLVFTLQKPFDKLIEMTSRPSWLHNHSISRTKKEKRDITKYTIPLFTKLNTEYMTDTMNCGAAILVFRKKLSRAA